MPSTATWQERSPWLIKEASLASVLAWNDRTGGSTLEEVEVEEEAHGGRPVAALAGLVVVVAATAGIGVATGPPQRTGSDEIFQNFSDESHPH